MAWPILTQNARTLNLNAHEKRSLGSTHIPSVLEPRHLHKADQKQPDDLTLVPWAVGRQILSDVTVKDLVASR